MHGQRNLGRAMLGLIFTGSMSYADTHCHRMSGQRAIIDEGPRQPAAAGPMIAPPFKGTASKCFERCGSPVRGPRADPVFDYCPATRFVFRAGAAAAPLGAGHGFWTP